MTTATLVWRFFVRAKDEAKAEKVCRQIVVLLDTAVVVVGNEAYWKDDSQRIVTLEIPLAARNLAGIVLETLTLNGRVFYGAEVSTPADDVDGWTFDGAARGGRVSGVENAFWSVIAVAEAIHRSREESGDPEALDV